MEMRGETALSVRRLARAFGLPRATVGRWVGPPSSAERKRRSCPVSGDPSVRQAVLELCDEPRHRTFGHRRIRALLLRRHRLALSRKTVLRIMRQEGRTRPRVWRKPRRPKRVERMRPTRPNRGWQIDMTSFHLSDLTPVYLVGVIDCFTRQVVGWTLERRCRASEWVSALRTAIESRGLATREACALLTLRSDNGSQPCSKRFREYLGSRGVRGQYTGYNAPDDNAYVERVFRTIKEEEVWASEYDTLAEARTAITEYIRYYNGDRIHQALDYRTPDEAQAAANITLAAA